MNIETRLQATDDYGVRGTLTFTDFSLIEIDELLKAYQDQVEKSDLGHFVKWTQLNHCLSSNKDIHVTYL